MMTRLRAMLLGSCLLVAGGDAAAQAPFLLLTDQELQFGQVTPGVPAVVLPTDATRRAALTLQGRGRASIVFTLPAFLQHATAGSTIPVTFAANDGLMVIRGRTTRFDPALPLDVRLNPADHEAALYLGATARPAPGQLAGTYTAVLTVMIIPSGT